MNVQVPAGCAADTPRSLTSLTASTLNSRVNRRLRMTHLRLHETPKLGVLKPGAAHIFDPVERCGGETKGRASGRARGRMAAVLKDESCQPVGKVLGIYLKV